MNDISEILRALLDQFARTSEVEREFANMMNNDAQGVGKETKCPTM